MLHYNREELEIAHRDRLNELIEFTDGSYSFLAKMLNVHVSTVQGWILRGRISKTGAKLVEKNNSLNKKFKAKYLRPDLN